MAKDVRTGSPDTPLESGGTWAVARLAHSLQSVFSIRTTYSDSICYCLDGAAPDSIAPPFRLGIRISMLSPCHPGEESLHLAHGEEFYPARIPSHADIPQPEGRGRHSMRKHFASGYITSGWERRTFQLLRSDISGSSGSAYPVRHAQLQCSPEAS